MSRIGDWTLRLLRGRARFGVSALAIVCVASLVSVTSGAAEPDQRLEIDTQSGPHVFSVEVMRTPAERERGLMGRQSMPLDHGMLFDFQTEQAVIFWMKDTLISLDMVFVAKDGRVVGIKHDAKPMDETLIPSGAPTLGVVELNGGVTETIGLKIGDLVKNPIFHN
jgi:uncharacterized membrane protein (UPF0127 family)